MPFSLDSNPELSEVAEAVNYLLANFGPNLAADPVTGQITGPQGIVIAYLYRYLSVKYADSFDGSVNFSNTPTNRGYYGVNNSDSTTESTNPADYIWYKVAGGFGTTKFLFYQTTGGRAIDFSVGTTAPSSNYVQDSGSAIDLDIITASVKANSATTAYLIQSQSSPTPSGFPQYTSGSSLPAGWSATLGTVSVGQVVWYTFGTYNGSTVTVNGIPANSTYWSSPIAASVFQDIRSDNWNGSNPPTFGVPATYGTTGYYIQRNTGDVFFNNGIFRGDISTDGDAYFEGKNPYSVIIPAFSQYADYSSFSYALTSTTSSNLRVGVLGKSSATTSYANIGVLGDSPTSGKGYGVVGTGAWVGGGFYGTVSSGSTALQAQAYSSSSIAFDIALGRMTTSNSTQVTNLNANYLQGYTASSFMLAGSTASDSNALGGYSSYYWARIFATNSGTANAAGSGINLLGSSSTGIAGAYVGTSGTSNVVTFTVQTTSPSDPRLKKDIEDSDLGLDFVKALTPKKYKLIHDPKNQVGYGFLTTDVEKLIPKGSSLVYHEPDFRAGDEQGFDVIHYPSYIAVLTKAIQELSAEVEELKKMLKG